MKHSQPFFFALVASMFMLLAAPPSVVAASGTARAVAQHAARTRVVMQMSDNDPGKWNLVFNNAQNIQSALGKGRTAIEIVAYGPGINMLKMDSPVANRVSEALANGIKIVACENTMHGMKLTPADMLPKIGYVPSGVIELIQKQQQGYAYIRP